MNKFALSIAAIVLLSLFSTVIIGLKYSQTTVLFGIFAAGPSYIAIHKIPNVNWAIGLLVGLAIFASFPLKKLFQFDGFVQEVPVTLIYVGALWVIGMGWKRNWKREN